MLLSLLSLRRASQVIALVLLVCGVLPCAPSTAAAELSPSDISAATERIRAESTVEYVCEKGVRGHYDPAKGPWALKEQCALAVKWLPRFTLGTSASVIPKQLVIVSVTDNQAYFVKKLPSSQLINEVWIPAAEWFSRARFRFGVRYEVWIQYDLIVDEAAGAGGVTLVGQTEIIDRMVRLSVFKPEKQRFTWQVTGKVYTAWEIGRDRDRSFIAPGISTGVGYRYSEAADDRDVLGLRIMTAIGPNLISKTEVVSDDGEVRSVRTRQKVQWLVGGEVVLGRYLSVGPAWVVMGNETSAMPMLMITYGELYPAYSID